MPITVSWFNDQKTTILVTYSTEFDWIEYYHAEAIVAQMMDASPSVVDCLIDFKPAAPPLDYGRQLPLIAVRSPFIHHPRVGHVVVCSQSRFMKSLVMIFLRLYDPVHGKAHHADTLEEGIELLKQIRSSNVTL